MLSKIISKFILHLRYNLYKYNFYDYFYKNMGKCRKIGAI